jgi:hypothetical protein
VLEGRWKVPADGDRVCGRGGVALAALVVLEAVSSQGVQNRLGAQRHRDRRSWPEITERRHWDRRTLLTNRRRDLCSVEAPRLDVEGLWSPTSFP